MGFRKISDRRSSYWKDSIAEIEVAEQPKKHREIDAFSHLSWVITAPNLFLVLILLMSFVTPSSCADSKTRTDNVRIQMPSGASKVGTKKGTAFTYSTCTSVPSALIHWQFLNSHGRRLRAADHNM
ncbi:hypothetical protein M378DRAFT_165627 [Amanita muscaria Koide BX008]|uniref:Transmembrane protein n=1 Tax=Amanita muscaria (strain Koide BX008) TaxID=946122 RepID=A0A0C2X0E2_AMAMK|nr:hypothetical protein M378DRAFT_165627 [Amanita muscaria Koide BX008]